MTEKRLPTPLSNTQQLRLLDPSICIPRVHTPQTHTTKIGVRIRSTIIISIYDNKNSKNAINNIYIFIQNSHQSYIYIYIYIYICNKHCVLTINPCGTTLLTNFECQSYVIELYAHQSHQPNPNLHDA